MAETVTINLKLRFQPTRVLPSIRELQKLSGFVKNDGQGVQDRQWWIMPEEDLKQDTLAYLKYQKRVAVGAVHNYI